MQIPKSGSEWGLYMKTNLGHFESSKVQLILVVLSNVAIAVGDSFEIPVPRRCYVPDLQGPRVLLRPEADVTSRRLSSIPIRPLGVQRNLRRQ